MHTLQVQSSPGPSDSDLAPRSGKWESILKRSSSEEHRWSCQSVQSTLVFHQPEKQRLVCKGTAPAGDIPAASTLGQSRRRVGTKYENQSRRRQCRDHKWHELPVTGQFRHRHAMYTFRRLRQLATSMPSKIASKIMIGGALTASTASMTRFRKLVALFNLVYLLQES